MRSHTHATRRTRRLAAAGAAALVAAVLPVALPVAPASAADAACLNEAQPKDPVVGQFPTGPGCDDTAPPETTIGAVTPAVNAAGWLSSTSVSIPFTGAYADADQDPITFQCQWSDGSRPLTDADWSSCTSPFTKDGLDPAGSTAYTFRVRAVDSVDNAHDLTADAWPYTGTSDLPDYDQTPASLQFRTDTTAPNTFGALRTDYDDETGGEVPMLVRNTAEVRLQSNEESAYRCTLDGRAVACADGITLLRQLKAGTRSFTAVAVDQAGNVDPTPFTQQFFVPRNLGLGDVARASSGAWRRVPDPNAFAGDALESSRFGATVQFPVRNIREIRLLAPAGPRLGAVQIRVGHSRWMSVNLRSSDAAGLKVYEVRDHLNSLMSGTLRIRVSSTGRPVRVDAVSAR